MLKNFKLSSVPFRALLTLFFCLLRNFFSSVRKRNEKNELGVELVRAGKHQLQAYGIGSKTFSGHFRYLSCNKTSAGDGDGTTAVTLTSDFYHVHFMAAA